jgi:hypothetical protein
LFHLLFLLEITSLPHTLLFPLFSPAPWWGQLNPAAGQITYGLGPKQSSITMPGWPGPLVPDYSNTFVVRFDRVPHADVPNVTVSFELFLRGDGLLVINYMDCAKSTADNLSHSSGVRFADDSGLSFYFGSSAELAFSAVELVKTQTVVAGGIVNVFTASDRVTLAPPVNGTSLILGDDTISSTLPIPFPFPFSNVNRTTFRVSSNGVLFFGTASASSFYSSGSNFISPFWFVHMLFSVSFWCAPFSPFLSHSPPLSRVWNILLAIHAPSPLKRNPSQPLTLTNKHFQSF